MGKLAEIELLVEELTQDEQTALLRVLAAKVGASLSIVKAPPPRDIPIETIRQWIEEDEAGMQRFRASDLV